MLCYFSEFSTSNLYMRIISIINTQTFCLCRCSNNKGDIALSWNHFDKWLESKYHSKAYMIMNEKQCHHDRCRRNQVNSVFVLKLACDKMQNAFERFSLFQRARIVCGLKVREFTLSESWSSADGDADTVCRNVQLLPGQKATSR